MKTPIIVAFAVATALALTPATAQPGQRHDAPAARPAPPAAPPGFRPGRDPSRPAVRPGRVDRPAPPGYRAGWWNGRRYYNPPGYQYRAWRTGQFLPRAYWASRYWWINDWNLWGLPVAPRHHRWVRVGKDAVLINTRNGRVATVRYGFFW